MPDIGYAAMMAARPGRTRPLTPQDIPLAVETPEPNGQADEVAAGAAAVLDAERDRLTLLSAGSEALAPLLAARRAVHVAVDDMVAKYSQDGTVSRVGVAQLRDAIDDLRQAIPRQRKRPVADE